MKRSPGYSLSLEDHDWLVDSKYILVSGSCILPLKTDHLPKIAALGAHKIESEI